MNQKEKPFIIRLAEPSDCKDIHRLIQELADYENMPTGPKITEDVLKEDGFGAKRFFNCFIAEVKGDGHKDGTSNVVGYALYFYTYSTWEGRATYMEDLYVTPKYRKFGIGTALWKAVAKESIKSGCIRLDFAVLDWNASSIDFYRKKGAVNLTTSEGWNLFRLNREAMLSLSEIK